MNANAVLLLGFLVFGLGVAGLVRALVLLEAAKEDRENFSDISMPSRIMAEYFVLGSYIRLGMHVLAIVAGVLIAASAMEYAWAILRFYAIPIVVLLVEAHVDLKGEAEARARRRVRKFYREQRRLRDLGLQATEEEE